MKIFEYDALKEKANREITRLTDAQANMNELDAIDHALNAAFSIYHLIECKIKDLELTKTSAYKYCVKSENPALKIVHHIVTINKHAEVSARQLESGAEVYFGEQKAKEILNEAMNEF